MKRKMKYSPLLAKVVGVQMEQNLLRDASIGVAKAPDGITITPGDGESRTPRPPTLNLFASPFF